MKKISELFDKFQNDTIEMKSIYGGTQVPEEETKSCRDGESVYDDCVLEDTEPIEKK